MKREKWIDILRGIAILAVVIDHLFVLYPQFRINLLWKHMYFSIAWFVFLSGYTSVLSAQKSKIWTFPKSYFLYYAKRFTILIPYFSASLLIFLWENNFRLPQLVWSEFWHKLLYFSSQPTYYFVNLICQLYLVFPLLFHLLKISKTRWEKIILSLTVLILAFIILPFKAPSWPFSPPGRIFGGVYFAAFFLGMLLAQKAIILNKFTSILSGFSFAIFEFYFIYAQGNFLSVAPDFLLIGWSISLLLVAKVFWDKFKTAKWPILFPLSILGKHTLSIYLFHFFILGYALQYKFTNHFIQFIVIFFSALSIPIIPGMIYGKLITTYKIFHKKALN